MDNNSNNNDELRFNKIYELLGDDAKKLDNNNNIFSNNSNNIFNTQLDTNNAQLNNAETNSISVNDRESTNNSINTNQLSINSINTIVLPTNKQINNEDKSNYIVDTSIKSTDLQINSKDNTTDLNNDISANNNVVEPSNSINDNDKLDTNIIQPNPINVISINEDNNKNIVNNDNKENIHNKDIFVNNVLIDKNFDAEDDYELYRKNKFISFLTNKKFLLIVFILIFIFVCIVVFKAFYYGKKVDHYEEFFTTIESKEQDYTIVYDDKEIDNETLKKFAASELINCINAKIDDDKIPDSIKSIMSEIDNYYNQSYDYFSFLYRDIYTGFTVSYNQNQYIFTASTIKGPTDIYIYEMASEGKVNLDEKLTYTGAYYNTGSGVLKNKPLNTKYSVRTLLEYSTVTSDNAAHNMLMDKYGRKNMLNFWQAKGTTAIFTADNNWGITNAHDASIYMQELYRFYVNNSEYGEPLMKNFMSAYPKFISGKNNYVVANKSGWSGTAIHDVSIVFADNPYIVVALSNLGNTDYYMSYFNKANDLAYKLHTEYWKYKMSQCNSIKQY